MPLDLKALAQTSIDIAYEFLWEGEGSDRTSRPDFNKVRCVQLGLSAQEWCDLAMRDGPHYIGGCCGTTSGLQDVINAIFRDSGYADANAMWDIGQYTKAHPDGFEADFTVRWKQKRFDKACADWAKLDPWKKIAVAWQAVRDKVHHSINEVPIVPKEPRPDLDEKRTIDELYGAIRFSRFSIFRWKDADDKWKQDHAQDVKIMAQLFLGAKALIRELEGNFTEFNGFAIVEKDRPGVVVHNGLGICVYSEREGAEETIAEWAEDNKEEANLVAIRPVKISIQSGLEFLDT